MGIPPGSNAGSPSLSQGERGLPGLPGDAVSTKILFVYRHISSAVLKCRAFESGSPWAPLASVVVLGELVTPVGVCLFSSADAIKSLLLFSVIIV